MTNVIYCKSVDLVSYSKVRSSNPAGNKKIFQLENSILTENWNIFENFPYSYENNDATAN